MSAAQRLRTALVALAGSRTTRLVLVGVACIAAVGSVYIGAVRATTPGADFGSGDFQWSPTRLLLEGGDPYAARLSGSDRIILTQSPNYLHLLYWVLAPFGAMPFSTALWSWMVLNVLAATALGLWYGRLAGCGRTGSVLFAAALLCSTPFRLGLSYGQHAVLVLACATVAFAAARRSWAGVALAVALTKYSFAPLGLVMLVRGRLRTVVMAGGALLLAAVAFSIVTGTDLGTALREPFQLSRASVGNGTADVMTVASFTPWLSANSPVLTVLALVTATGATACAVRVLREGDWVFGLGVSAMISLVSFKHLTHDFVLLLPVLVLLLRLRGPRAWLGWAGIAYHWYVLGVLSQLGAPLDTPAVTVVSFVVLSGLLVLVTTAPGARRSRSPELPSEPGRPRPADAERTPDPSAAG